MVERFDESGSVTVLNPNTVDSIEASDRIYLFLAKDDLKKVERALEN